MIERRHRYNTCLEYLVIPKIVLGASFTAEQAIQILKISSLGGDTMNVFAAMCVL